MLAKNNQLGLSFRYFQLARLPVPLVPFSSDALYTLSDVLQSNTDLTAAGLYAATGLGGPQSAKGWDAVEPGNFNFPQEHGPHWTFRNEWYYAALNLTYVDSNKVTQPLTILLAIIRRGTVPNPDSNMGTPAQFQVVGCEATVELPGTSTPYLTASAAFDGFNNPATMLAPSSTQPFQWSVISDTQLFGLASVSTFDMFPMNCGIRFTAADGTTVTAQLTLQAPTNPQYFVQGQNGCAPCLDGLGYRYYSWPALTVSGTVTVGSTAYVCTGQGWLDHQWGSRMQPLGYIDNLYLRAVGILAGTYPKQLAPQWDWFFMHLDNGMHITTSVLPSQGYSTPGSQAELTNTTIVTVNSDNIMSFETFQGNGNVRYSNWVEINCSWYASYWTIQIGSDIVLNISPAQAPPAGFSKGVDGQTFMEKAVTVSGTINGSPVKGVGFAEAIGYDSLDKQLYNMLSQIYLPEQVQTLLPLFRPASASAGDIALASTLVIGPPVALLIIIVTVTAVLLKKKAKKRT